MAEMDQLTKGMNREAENAEVFLVDPPRCPDSGRRLCGCCAVSYTRSTQCDANPTDRYIGAANLFAHATLYGAANPYGHAALYGHTNRYRDFFASSQRQRRRTDRFRLQARRQL